MRHVKKLHQMVLLSWIGPFLAAFSGILFVLALQFLYKYMDDLSGKGFDFLTLGKLFGFCCVGLVTMAMPLAVLLSSLMTMGNMGERYELAALKSSGIGLFKIVRPLRNGTIFLTIGLLLFSFYLVPQANLKLYTLLHDLAKVKPSFALKEGHFYNDIDGMVINVGRIDREKDVLHEVKIFDHRGKVGNNRTTLAHSGIMRPSGLAGELQMTLFNGVIHEEISAQPAASKPADQYHRFYFDTLEYKVGMDGFDLKKSDEDLYKGLQYMQTINGLFESVDSMENKLLNHLDDHSGYLLKHIHLNSSGRSVEFAEASREAPLFESDGTILVDTDLRVEDWFPETRRAELLEQAIRDCRSVKNYSQIIQTRLDNEKLKIRKFKMEIHSRFALPISCLVFLFIGAPLGAIIRKGGIGMPILISIGFFVLFYISMIQGRKLAKDEFLSVGMGIWLPNLVISPMSLLFSWSSARDWEVLSSDFWLNRWKMIWMRKRNQL